MSGFPTRTLLKNVTSLIGLGIFAGGLLAASFGLRSAFLAFAGIGLGALAAMAAYAPPTDDDAQRQPAGVALRLIGQTAHQHWRILLKAGGGQVLAQFAGGTRRHRRKTALFEEFPEQTDDVGEIIDNHHHLVAFQQFVIGYGGGGRRRKISLGHGRSGFGIGGAARARADA